ncbi:MAG TPA: tyrosine-type recombinase/integrase [Acidobacteriaceae bacterium]|nr:tyrosine-type recombinase/integrase [Acidobacteriaceae bacterium]
MIYKRGKAYSYNFRWSIRLEDGTVESFRIRQSAKTHKRKEAEDAENEHKRALRLGEIHPNDPWPKPAMNAAPVFRSFAKEFLQFAKTHTKAGTHTFYSVCLDRLLTFAAIADAPLNAITGETVSRYARHRQEVPKNSVVTVNGDLRTLRRVLHLAVEWGKLNHAPAIHELPQPQGRDRVLTFAEEAKYLAKASENLRDAAILAVDTGMRPNSELFPLRWADVDLTAGVIHVRQGKTDSAQRSLPLTPRAAEVLQRRKNTAEAKPSAFVFPGAGISGHITSVQHPHKAAIESAGLASFEFYCWRHTFGTRAAQSGMDRFTLARLMGHSSPAVAARYYIHVTERHVAAGFEKFVEYQTRNVAEGLAAAFPQASESVQ